MIFLLFTLYIIFQVNTIIPTYIHEINSQRLKSEAYQLSEILIDDLGEPVNWENLPIENVKRIGLSNESENKTNFLSMDKINKLNSICSNNGYDTLVTKLGISDYQVAFNLTNVSSGENLISCRPTQIISRGFKIKTTRIAAAADTVVKLTLEVW